MKNNKLAWDKLYKKDKTTFSEIHPDMPKILKLLKKNKAKTILDLGCGTGRHVVYFSKESFNIYGVDISSAGIKESKRRLKESNLIAKLQKVDITKKLNFEKNFFDAVISTQVIHHAKKEIVYKIIKEITRVLKQNGLIFITVPTYKKYSKKHPGWLMKRISTRTFLPLDGPEKGLVHYFFTPSELKIIFEKNYNISRIYEDETKHYAVLGSKK